MPQILARFLWCSYPSHTPSHPLLYDLQIYIPHNLLLVVRPLYFYLQIYMPIRSFVVVVGLTSFHLLRWATPNRSRQRKDRFATFRYILHASSRGSVRAYACEKFQLYFFVIFRYNIINKANLIKCSYFFCIILYNKRERRIFYESQWSNESFKTFSPFFN